MKPFDPTSILGYGIIGLGFLLALLSFWLLQSSRNSYRGSAAPIYAFMVFSVAVIVLGILHEYAGFTHDEALKTLTTENGQLRKELDAANDRLKMAETARLTRQADLFARIGNLRKSVADMRPTIDSCRSLAWGASTNTSDTKGCVGRAIEAMNSGISATAKADALDGALAEFAAQGR